MKYDDICKSCDKTARNRNGCFICTSTIGCKYLNKNNHNTIKK